MKNYFFLFSLLLTAFYGNTQVINDDIRNRIPLVLNESTFSKTDNCTLQMQCINEKLTGQCITYHNDQWFEFTPTETKPYFINLSKQECKDILGVQLVIFDGKPCEPDDHKLITCVSLANQDDIFVRLDSLTAHTTYLLLVDGYLQDYCGFTIEFSDQPKGIPFTNKMEKESFTSYLYKHVLHFKWKVKADKCANYEKYIVYRRFQNEKKSKIIRTVAHTKSVMGENNLAYGTEDTLLKKGLYEYKIVACTYDSTFELVEQFSKRIERDADDERKYTKEFLTIHKTFKRSVPVAILIEDVLDNNKVIYFKELPPSQEHYKRLYLKEFLDKGSTQFRVTIQNRKNNKKEVTIYDWTKYLIN